MAFNYSRLQKLADTQIQKFGARCVLRRVGLADRDCFAAIMTFDPHEDRGQITNLVRRYALISPLGLAIAPNAEKDSLVTFVPATNPPTEYEVLKLFKPSGRLAPAGIVVYYEVWIEG